MTHKVGTLGKDACWLLLVAAAAAVGVGVGVAVAATKS